MENQKKWYQKISNWIIILVSILLVPVLLINILIMVQANANKDEVPSVFGIKPFIVLSGSMESEIFKGDLILTKVVDPETLKEKDIIAFRDSMNTVTTHRITELVEIKGVPYFVTKGDNNDSQDQYLVEYGDVEGIYIMRIPGIGSMMNSLSNPTTIVILVLGITVIFGIGFIIASKKEANLEKQEFLEYKRMKELEEKNNKKLENNDAKKEVKKASSKKNNNKKSSK